MTAEERAPSPEDREQWLGERLRRLCVEDDFAGALEPLARYPRFESRSLSVFEDDLRDWGFVYGLAFGLALAEWPDEPHEEIARLVFETALSVFRRWSGEIEDPVAKREMALRAVVQRFADVERDRNGDTMDADLSHALSDLSAWARG